MSLADLETLKNDVKAVAAEYYTLENKFAAYRAEAEMERTLTRRPDLRRLLIKAAPDSDLYVAWSMVADAPTGYWSRQDALDYGFFHKWLDMCDDTGSNSVSGTGNWEDNGFVVEGRAWLRRDRIGDYVQALGEGRKEEAEAMLEKTEG